LLLGRGGLIPFTLWKMGFVGRNFTRMQTEAAIISEPVIFDSTWTMTSSDV
jgi:hypothetical protein